MAEFSAQERLDLPVGKVAVLVEITSAVEVERVNPAPFPVPLILVELVAAPLSPNPPAPPPSWVTVQVLD